MSQSAAGVGACTRDLELSHHQLKQPSTPKRSALRGTSSSSSLGQTQQAYADMLSSAVEKTRQDLARAQAREEAELKHMLRRTDRDQIGFVRDIDTYIETHQVTKLQHKQQLCRSWHAKVYNAIQGQVDAQLALLSSSELNIRRNELMDSYLRISNQKARGLFRDIIFPSEYDPLRAHETGIQYSVSSLADPLREEVITLPGQRALTAGGLGRATFDVTMWNKLEATPYRQTNLRKFAACGANRGTSTSLEGLFDHFGPAFISAY